MLWKDAYNYRAVTLRHDITLDRVISFYPTSYQLLPFRSLSGVDTMHLSFSSRRARFFEQTCQNIFIPPRSAHKLQLSS